MEKLYKDIVVDLYQPYPLPTVEMKQYDTARGVRITLIADSAIVTPQESVQIYIKKPDGTAVYANCTISGTQILADFPEQANAVAGTCEAEIYMINGDDVLSTPIFELVVYPSNMDARKITSSDDFQVLRDALEDVNDLKQNGLKGDAATIQIGTVTASEPGGTPQVTNTGTEKAAVFNFILPRGDTGPQGPQGPSGSVDTLEVDLALTDADISDIYNDLYPIQTTQMAQEETIQEVGDGS